MFLETEEKCYSCGQDKIKCRLFERSATFEMTSAAHVSLVKSRNLLTLLQSASPAGRHVSASPPPNAPCKALVKRTVSFSLPESAGLVPLCDALLPFRQTRLLGCFDSKKAKSLSQRTAEAHSLSCNLSNTQRVRSFYGGIAAW